MHAVGKIAGEAMESMSGNSYTVGSAAKVLWPAAGKNSKYQVMVVNNNSSVGQQEAKYMFTCIYTFMLFSGGSDDWAAGSLGIPFSYTVELPDKGRHGFILPAAKIESTGREAFAGLEAMVRELIRLSWI